jgi:hypothetical protein
MNDQDRHEVSAAWDMDDAELAAHLRDPSTNEGFLPQWIRDDIAERLEHVEDMRQRWARLG